MRSLLLAPLALTLTLSCRSSSPQAPRETDAALLTRTEAAATTLAARLRGRLTETLRAQGPAAAAEVCAREAQGMVAEVAAQTGVTVGRSSLRLRSQADVAPPWVGAWLSAQGERAAAGVTGVREVQGERAHILRPIAVEGPCLLCHGAREAIPAGVVAVLAARYPTDRATGYQAGDLRGALWAEATRR